MKTPYTNRLLHLLFILMIGLSAMGTLAVLIFVVFDEPRHLTTFILLGLNFGLWFLPFALMLWKKAFDPFHPLAYLAIFYAVPMIFIKGLTLILGRPLTYLLNTPAPAHYLNLALVCTLVGWGAVLLGFYSPLGGWLSRLFKLPRVMARGETVRLPALICMITMGVAFTVILMRAGAFGSALNLVTGNIVLVSLLRPLSNWLLMGFFLTFFFAIQRGLTRGWLMTCLGVSAVMFMAALISGSRAQLFIMILIAAAAVFYARFPHIRWRLFAGWIPAAALALILGMLFISQYRLLRTFSYGISPVSTSENINLLQQSIGVTSDLTFDEQVEFAVDRFTERFSSLELLGLTLALARTLEKAEREAGIDNNIMKDLGYGLVPRVIWPEKPIMSDFGLWFTRLYLNSNSLNWNGPSAFGDLYRNFGYLGIPLGMFIVGVYLRVLYQTLIIRNYRQSFCAMFYIFLLQTFNLEATYSQFITVGLRMLLSLILFMFCLCLISNLPSILRKLSRRSR